MSFAKWCLKVVCFLLCVSFSQEVIRIETAKQISRIIRVIKKAKARQCFGCHENSKHSPWVVIA